MLAVDALCNVEFDLRPRDVSVSNLRVGRATDAGTLSDEDFRQVGVTKELLRSADKGKRHHKETMKRRGRKKNSCCRRALRRKEKTNIRRVIVHWCWKLNAHSLNVLKIFSVSTRARSLGMK